MPNGAVCRVGDSRSPSFAYGVYRTSELGYIAVDRIIVAPQHRRRDVAQALMAHVRDAFPGTGMLMAAWGPALIPFNAALGSCEDNNGNMSYKS